MAESIRALLRLEAIGFPRGEWWKDTAHAEKLLSALKESGLWLDFRYHGKSGGRLARLTAAEELPGILRSWETGLYSLTTDQKEDPACELGFTIEPGNLSLRYLVNDLSSGSLRSRVIEQFVGLVLALRSAYDESVSFGPDLGVEILGLPYRRVRPPRLDRMWKLGRAVTFLSKSFHERDPRGQLDSLEKLMRSPMPEGGERSEEGDLVVFRWVEDLVDWDDVARRLSLQEEWLTGILDLPVHPSYNDLGDYLETPLDLEQNPYVTFYDPDLEEGFKATVLGPGDTVDEDLFSEMESWIEAGELPDESPLDSLSLIVPNRRSALAIRKRAKSIGIDRVLYTDDEGQWWDPDPPGLWLEGPGMEA